MAFQCRWGCETWLTTSDSILSRSGKYIPLEEHNLKIHECNLNPYYKSKNKHVVQDARAKLCKNGCEKLIRWDGSQNKYLEIDTNDRHRCPNCNPKQEHPPDNVNHKITHDQQLYLNTIGPAILEIRSAVQNIERLLTEEKREVE